MSDPAIRPARASDARDLAELDNLAGDGLPMWLWGHWAEPGQSPMDVGAARFTRGDGGFSFRDAVVYEIEGATAGALTSYRLPDPADPFDVAQVPGPLVPILELEVEAPGSWYINALAVFPRFRGRGVATALVGCACKLARRSGVATISLIVAGGKPAVVRLYKKLGFAAVARRPVVPIAGLDLAGDWILMIRSLADDPLATVHNGDPHG